ncbi:hypothetical protein EAG_11751 [Camponotus floridanus]|uniref:Uncharacterized protein n=1 Tax=Camponotus floridanus TaxID=104421 RepID=E2AYI0_CAMFO|nr:hypothetical protein EAG_11751 [Camponotus floridanus]
MDQKEGEGEEVREEKELKESLQIYVYRFVERRKTARVPLALLHEKGERNRRRQARRQKGRASKIDRQLPGSAGHLRQEHERERRRDRRTSTYTVHAYTKKSLKCALSTVRFAISAKFRTPSYQGSRRYDASVSMSCVLSFGDVSRATSTKRPGSLSEIQRPIDRPPQATKSARERIESADFRLRRIFTINSVAEIMHIHRRDLGAFGKVRAVARPLKIHVALEQFGLTYPMPVPFQPNSFSFIIRPGRLPSSRAEINIRGKSTRTGK